MKKTVDRSRSLKKTPFRYCPGCGHIIIHRLIAEVIDGLNIRERVIGIAPVGCAVFAHEYFDFDMLEAAHGRPPAAATGMKRVSPDSIVFSYQGDGDLAAIGTAEIIHAANRGENISVFFINNATYGMTGGQMAPTTILGQITTTTPNGRDGITTGYPLHVAEMLATLDTPSLIARTSIDSPANVKNTRELIERSFRRQMENKGFSMIEILSACPTNWNMTPAQATMWLREKLMDVFKLGVFKDAL